MPAVALPVFDFPHVRIAGLYFPVKQKCQWAYLVGLLGFMMLLQVKIAINGRATRFKPRGPLTSLGSKEYLKLGPMSS